MISGVGQGLSFTFKSNKTAVKRNLSNAFVSMEVGGACGEKAQQYFPLVSSHFSSESCYLGTYDSYLPFWIFSYLSVHSFLTSVPHLQPRMSRCLWVSHRSLKFNMSKTEPLISLSTVCDLDSPPRRGHLCCSN